MRAVGSQLPEAGNVTATAKTQNLAPSPHLANNSHHRLGSCLGALVGDDKQHLTENILRRVWSLAPPAIPPSPQVWYDECLPSEKRPSSGPFNRNIRRKGGGGNDENLEEYYSPIYHTATLSYLPQNIGSMSQEKTKTTIVA